MTTRNALIAAVLLLVVSFVVGLYWPQIWGAVWLIIAPLLAAPYTDEAPKLPEEDPPDDSEITDIQKDAADSDNRYRAAIRRAKAARARLRRSADGDGGGTNGS